MSNSGHTLTRTIGSLTTNTSARAYEQHRPSPFPASSTLSSSNSITRLRPALARSPLLTWRDVQHIIVQTAQITDRSDAGWFTTKVRRTLACSYVGVCHDGLLSLLTYSRYGIASPRRTNTHANHLS